MYNAIYLNPLDGETYYLRGTILTRDKDRASLWPSEDAAWQGIVKAKKEICPLCGEYAHKPGQHC